MLCMSSRCAQPARSFLGDYSAPAAADEFGLRWGEWRSTLTAARTRADA